MNRKLFLSAKQKKLLRERRKKKKLREQEKPTPLNETIEETSVPVTSSSSSSLSETTTTSDGKLLPKENAVNTTSSNKKRQRSDEVVTESGENGNNDDIDDGQNQSNTTTEKLSAPIHDDKDANDEMIVVIPSNLTAKEVRAFRKKERRKVRNENKDDSKILFLTEEEYKKRKEAEEEPVKKKRKRTFPNINELVELSKREEMIQKQKTLNATLSTDYTSKYVAIDCEMVGVGTKGRQSALARVSITDWNGDVVLDTYVKVPEKVTDYRTWVSGIKPKHIRSGAMDLKDCRMKVGDIIRGKILVGHAIKNDLDALLLSHPKDNIRDTAKYRPFQKLLPNTDSKYRARKLRDLVKEFCNIDIQQHGQSHDSVEDARGTMELYKMVHTDWEREMELSKRKSYNNKDGKKK